MYQGLTGKQYWHRTNYTSEITLMNLNWSDGFTSGEAQVFSFNKLPVIPPPKSCNCHKDVDIIYKL